MPKNSLVLEERRKNRMKKKIITYAELAERVGDMVLCNEMECRFGTTMELEHGELYDEETDSYTEIFQWFIISSRGAEYLKEYTEQLVFYDEELDLYVWGITFYGIGWDGINVTVRCYY